MRAIEEALVLLLWIALLPFALVRRVAGGSSGSPAARSGWIEERRSLAAASASEPPPPFARVARAWLRVRRVLGAP